MAQILVCCCSSGPFSMLPYDSVKIAFALLGGDSLNEIVAAATAAQLKYNSVGITEVATLENELLVYPNPAKSVLNVQVLNPNSGVAKIELYDVYGHLVAAKTYLQTRTNTLNLDISTLSNGIYFMQYTSNQINKTIKINIQNDKP